MKYKVKMKRIISAPLKLTASILLLCCNLFSATAQTAQLYVSMSDLGPKTKSFMQQNNVKELPVIYTKMVDPDNSLTVNEQALSAAINKYIPDSNASGYACIDWENKLSAALQLANQNSPEFKNAQNEFIKALKIAKRLRPKILWGFFGVPFQPLDPKDSRKVNPDIPLAKMVDVYFPQLYFDYNQDRSGGLRSNTEKDLWVKYNLASVLKVADKYNKPVLGFIWHRFYSAGFKQNSLQLIPDYELDGYVKSILKLSYNGRHVVGLTMWGNDTYFFGSKDQGQPLQDEFNSTGRSDFSSYHDDLITKYLTRINNTMVKGGAN